MTQGGPLGPEPARAHRAYTFLVDGEVANSGGSYDGSAFVPELVIDTLDEAARCLIALAPNAVAVLCRKVAHIVRLDGDAVERLRTMTTEVRSPKGEVVETLPYSEYLGRLAGQIKVTGNRGAHHLNRANPEHYADVLPVLEIWGGGLDEQGVVSMGTARWFFYETVDLARAVYERDEVFRVLEVEVRRWAAEVDGE